MCYLVVGYYGYANAGDETLLRRTIELISHGGSSPTIYVIHPKKPVCPPPDHTIAVDRFNVWELAQTIRKVDAVVFGGGGIFQDQSSIKSLLYYASIVWIASILKTPVILIGQGFSAPKRAVSYHLIRFALKRTNWIGCRDSESLDLINKLYSDAPAIQTGDLALLSPPPNHLPIGQYIAISLRNTEFNAVLSTTIGTWITDEPNPVIGISFEGKNDTNVLKHNGIEQIYQMGENFPGTPLDAQPLLVVAMRYHACVWAALNGRPFIALAYDDKVASIAKALGQPCIDLRNIEKDVRLADIVARIKQNLTTYTNSINQKLPKIVSEAKKNQLPFHSQQ